MHATTFFAVLLTFLGSVTAANAQTAGPPRAGQRNSDGHVEKWFDASGLEVGDAFPAVAVFDEQGKPFNTRSLKGQYTVVVNGCLT